MPVGCNQPMECGSPAVTSAADQVPVCLQLIERMTAVSTTSPSERLQWARHHPQHKTKLA